MTLAPGSISQMTCSSSPRPSSSTEESVSRCCGPPKAGLRARRRQRAGPHVVDDPLPGADADQLALFGVRRGCRGGHGLPSAATGCTEVASPPFDGVMCGFEPASSNSFCCASTRSTASTSGSDVIAGWTSSSRL